MKKQKLTFDMMTREPVVSDKTAVAPTDTAAVSTNNGAAKPTLSMKTTDHHELHRAVCAALSDHFASREAELHLRQIFPRAREDKLLNVLFYDYFESVRSGRSAALVVTTADGSKFVLAPVRADDSGVSFKAEAVASTTV
jgi:hypothetical protein